FDLNLVTGWNKPQYAQMGLWPGDEYFGLRYEYGEEYATILKELWTTGKSDFKGRFYQLDDCQLGLVPDKPVGLICAGQSDRGLKFTAEYGDYSDILGQGTGVEGVSEVVGRVEAACARAERSLTTLLVVLVVLAETDEEAEAKVARYVEHADTRAIATMQGDASLDANGSTAGLLTNAGNATFQNLEKIIGSPSTVAAYFDELAEIESLEGVIMVFDEAIAGLEMFGNEVLPRMRSRAADPATASS
ncbi:MAG: LLM class flavin-dependent oxidoreductase, partial [Rhodococcus sp. (in: high G+C Gram-positive bacteria)]|uniref:LLM class flavin-dependent oxidoreductase n=1 Tax=Rhodococcus sp. TaxID=1831 RepID=UPI003BB1ABE9